MTLADIVRLPRNVQRGGEIVVVLARYGFGPLLARLNLQRYIPFAHRLLRRSTTAAREGLTDEQRLVKAFQELGTTFIKLGQILSTRPDIVGESFAEEFKRLRDQVAPFDSAVVRTIVEAELKLSIGEVFSSFDEQPTGCGSIAQVHGAVLLDGTPVMVKVRRPGIESAIMADLAIMRFIARLAEPQLPELRPSTVVDEFERTIRDELDFTVEAASTAWFHQALKDNPAVRAPAVYWKYTTPGVLTIERLSGVPIGNTEELERRGQDRCVLAKNLAECFMDQYLRTGTFHADPHAGNLLVDDDGVIGIIDFGMVGQLTTEVKGLLSTALIAAVKGEVEFIAETAAEVGEIGEDFDQRQFTRDLVDLYHKYRGMPLGHIDTKRLFGEIIRTARNNDLSLPRDLVLLGKSLGTISSVAKTLDPSVDILRLSAPKTQEYLKERLSPKRLASRAGLNALSLMRMLRKIPQEIQGILRKAEAGQFQIGFRHRGLDRAMSELDRASNRLAISIYVAALLVASSLLIRSRIFAIGEISVPGILGYALAGLLSLWLAWGILKSGRL